LFELAGVLSLPKYFTCTVPPFGSLTVAQRFGFAELAPAWLAGDGFTGWSGARPQEIRLAAANNENKKSLNFISNILTRA